MIFAPLLLLGGVILQLFVVFFGTLGWTFPTAITNAVVTFLGVLHTFSQFLPFISTIVAIALVLMPAKIIRYTIDTVLFMWSLVPWIGTRTRVPAGTSVQIDTKRDFFSKSWESRATTSQNKIVRAGKDRWTKI